MKQRSASEAVAARPGFSLMELIIVLGLLAVVAAITLPTLGRTVARVRLQHAATLVASELQLARTLAARQRSPVLLSIDSTQKVIRVRDYVNPATVYAEHRFDETAENAIGRLEASDTSLVIYPSGLAAKQLELRLTTVDERRVVRMTRAGQIRIEQ